ncbi:MAG: hypothetical protein KatS3mg102_2331 [Planctomycetota bacterium]|nr:MAG: hypothetical protein KatS3mg102_2331 [Planctomycetota bacterium]
MCAHAVRVAIERLEGVRSVQVHLETGQVRIELAPGNRVTLERVRQLVRESGFSPRQAAVELIGTLRERERGLALAVSGLELVVPLAAHPEAPEAFAALVRRHQAGRAEPIRLRALAPAAPPGEGAGARPLQVLSWSAPPAAPAGGPPP